MLLTTVRELREMLEGAEDSETIAFVIGNAPPRRPPFGSDCKRIEYAIQARRREAIGPQIVFCLEAAKTIG